ncbi:MAG: glycosyltransferase family 4 protein [Candidatus Bathyarchaeia archaeon]
MRVLSIAFTPPSKEMNVRLRSLLKGLAELGCTVNHYGLRPLPLTKGGELFRHVIINKGRVTQHEFYSVNLLRKYVIARALVSFAAARSDIVVAKDPLSLFVSFLKKADSKLILDYEDVISLELALRGNLASSTKYVRLERIAGLLSHVVITENEYLRRYLISRIGLPPVKVLIVPNGVDTELFNPYRYDAETVKKSLNLRGPIIGFSGKSIQPFYVTLLFKALPYVLKHYAETKVLIIGPKEEWVNKYIPDKNAIVFTGYVSHEEVPKYLSAVDVAVNPVSKLTVGSIKILEYLSMGKPVVATTKLINDHLKKSKACIVVKPDPESIGEAICWLLADHEERKAMGEAGRNYAKKYDWSLISRLFLQAICQ